MSNVDSTIETQNIISMCPGIGGLERGLARAALPIRTICYVEIEAFIVANLVAQMEVGLLDQAPIWTNVKTFDGAPFRGMVHGITAGYPCQPFSHAGDRKGTEDPRHLWPYILEQIKVIGPEWVYFENVSGHLTLGYEEVRRSLSDIGYRVEEGIFTAEEVGAPHRRERLFILGVMENAGILRWGGRGDGNNGRSQRENKTTRSSTTVGNAAGGNKQHDGPTGSPEHIPNRRSGSNVATGSVGQANSNGDDTGTESGSVSSPQGESYGEEDKREWLRGKSGPFNTEMGKERSSVVQDDTFNEGLQGYAGHDSREGRWPKQERSVAATSLFPAGQGLYQHEWEEPRTIESGMEYTIDGYNFTEDLHRAIGNSVVEQTAEKAFIDLIHKHIKTASYGKT